MKQASIIFLALIAWSCQDVKIGYLKTDNAEYVPAEMMVRSTLDPVEDKVRIDNNSPWVTAKIQGVLGTPPLYYEFVGVKATEGGDAEAFKKAFIVRGGGIMEMPLFTKMPKGHYTVTLKVSNEGYSEMLPDVFTFIVE